MKRAAGAGLLAVAVAAGVVSGVTLAHDHTTGHTASYNGPPLPASFTAPDRAVYHQLAVTSLAVPAQRYARLTVHVGSEPVAVVLGACDSSARGVAIDFKVENGDFGLIICRATPQVVDLSVRPGRTAVITFVQASRLGEPDFRASWQLGVYEWTPPAALGPAPAAPRPPNRYTDLSTATGHGTALRRLIASRSGNWPGDRTTTFSVTPHGRSAQISVACAGTIGGTLQVSIQIDGSRGQKLPCVSWTPGMKPQATVSISGGAGTPFKVTFRIQAPSPDMAAAYAKRTASWTIAVYEEQS